MARRLRDLGPLGFDWLDQFQRIADVRKVGSNFCLLSLLALASYEKDRPRICEIGLDRGVNVREPYVA